MRGTFTTPLTLVINRFKASEQKPEIPDGNLWMLPPFHYPEGNRYPKSILEPSDSTNHAEP